MDHYQHLIIKGLINRGGSSSESYTYQLLTGDFSDSLRSVEHAWNYLDRPLQQELVTIFNDICGLDLDGIDDGHLIEKIKEYMASKGGRTAFFEYYDREQIERMSDEVYEQAIESCIEDKRKLLADK